jgi:hypothetical protein
MLPRGHCTTIFRAIYYTTNTEDDILTMFFLKEIFRIPCRQWQDILTFIATRQLSFNGGELLFFLRTGLSAPIYHVTQALVNPFHCSCVRLVATTPSRVSTGTTPPDLFDTRGYWASFMMSVPLTHKSIKFLTYLTDTSMQLNTKVND